MVIIEAFELDRQRNNRMKSVKIKNEKTSITFSWKSDENKRTKKRRTF